MIYHEYGAVPHKKPTSMEELKAWAKNVMVRGGPSGAMQIVAYEKTGLEGKRYVITAMGSALELEEPAFNQVVPAR